MKNLYFRVITVALALYFTGTMANPSRKSSRFFDSGCQWNGYLLRNCSLAGKQDTPVGTQAAATVGRSSVFFRILSQSPTKEERNIKHLELSNKLVSKITLSPLAHLRGLETLNLNSNANLSLSLDLPSPKSSRVKRHRSSLKNGLPHPKLLILQRNKFSGIPKGLWKLKSLQNLDLSFNGILQIGVFDFHNCLQVENLYLRSNKIFRIHPEPFKDLKKLQVVDLGSNALTAILPVMAVALGLPPLEADLAGSQWQCDRSLAVFQKVISRSWRRKWPVICSKSIGHEEAHWWTPKRRIPRETQRAHTHLNRTTSLRRSRAGRPREGPYVGSATPGKGHAGSGTSEQHRPPPRRVRSAQHAQAAGRQGAASPDLALAVCLAVFLTFFVAFCLGALTRPYMDRLWQQRCRKKRPSSDLGYANEGFYDDVEAAGGTQHPRADLHLAHHALNLGETQHAFSGTQGSPQGSPQAALTADRALGRGRKEPGRGQSRGPCGDDTGAGRDDALPNGSAACGQPRADRSALGPAEQDRASRSRVLGEISYETEAQGGSLSAYSTGVPGIAGRLRTGSGSIHKDSDALDPQLSREETAALCKAQTYTRGQGSGGNEDREGTEPLPWESSKEKQASTPISLLDGQEPRLRGAGAEEGRAARQGSARLRDPGHRARSPRASPPGRGSGPPAAPADADPAQKRAPPDTQYALYSDDDSDEGSLFTLSSESSEGARDVAEEEAEGEGSPGTSEPPEDGDPGVRKEGATSSERLEDSATLQKIRGECENREERFENPLTSGSGPGLCESRGEGASHTHEPERPSAWPGRLGASASRDAPPGTFTSDRVPAAPSEAAGWHRSLRDLEFSRVDISPQTPACSAHVPSGPDETASRERDADMCTYGPCIQGADTDENNRPFQIMPGGHLRPSQQGSGGGSGHSSPTDTGVSEGDVCPPKDQDTTQLLQFGGDEPALQCERGGGEYFEEGCKSQVPLLQELPNKTTSLRTREPPSDGDRGDCSEETLLQAGKDGPDFSTQTETHSNPMGADRLGEGLLSRGKDSDVQPENQRQCK